MEEKNITVRLYPNTIFSQGTSEVISSISAGFRHPFSDLIFIINPKYIKHELYALGCRDIGLFSEPHCKDTSCFCSSGVKQDPETKLCEFHEDFIKREFSGKFKYNLYPIIFGVEDNRFNNLQQYLEKYAEEFSEQVGIPIEVTKIEEETPLEQPFWLVITHQDYFHIAYDKKLNNAQQVYNFLVKYEKEGIERFYLVIPA